MLLCYFSIFLLFSLIGIIIYVYRLGFKSAEEKSKIKQQSDQLLIQNEIIKENKAVSSRKIKNEVIPINDDIIWLQQNNCIDCNK